MSATPLKRPPATSETPIGPTSCTNLGYYHSLNLTTFRSEETAVHRRDKGGIRHRKGVSRRLSTPQIVFGRNKYVYQDYDVR